MHKQRPDNPEFCFISPINYLSHVTCSHTHLVLAHLVDLHEEYSKFYKKLSDMGDYIIMDNSAYELKRPFNPTELVRLGELCGAHAIVLPDYPFKPAQDTIEAANNFIPIFKANGFDTFFVPQSARGDLDDWIAGYEYASNNDDIDIIGMSILGIPNAIPAIDPIFSRVVMTNMLIDRQIFNTNKHHHYLGLNSGPNLEIPSLLRMNALDTIDSSGPIWHALLGHEYSKNFDSFQSTVKSKMPVDFTLPKTNDAATNTRISHNMRLTSELFNGNVAECVWYADEQQET